MHNQFFLTLSACLPTCLSIYLPVLRFFGVIYASFIEAHEPLFQFCLSVRTELPNRMNQNSVHGLFFNPPSSYISSSAIVREAQWNTFTSSTPDDKLMLQVSALGCATAGDRWVEEGCAEVHIASPTYVTGSPVK